MLPTLDSIPVHDRQTCMELLDGDQELLDELLVLFAENTQLTLNSLETAVNDHDAAAVGLAAHAIKGSAANLCAERVRALASDLELAAREGRHQVFAEFVPALQKEFQTFVREIVTA